MNDYKDYFRLILCWNQLPPHSRVSGSFHIGKDWRLISMLEGGYNVDALARSVEHYLEGTQA